MRKLPKTISEAEFLEVIKKIDNPKHKLALLLGFYGGLRVSEVIHLKPENIDSSGFIHILSGKGKKDRDIPVPKPISKLLSHLPIDMTRQGLHKMMKKYWPEHHFHTLRHSAATYYIQDRGLDVTMVAALLGHSDIKITQIYTHIKPEGLKNKFDEIFG